MFPRNRIPAVYMYLISVYFSGTIVTLSSELNDGPVVQTQHTVAGVHSSVFDSLCVVEFLSSCRSRALDLGRVRLHKQVLHLLPSKTWCKSYIAIRTCCRSAVAGSGKPPIGSLWRIKCTGKFSLLHWDSSIHCLYNSSCPGLFGTEANTSWHLASRWDHPGRSPVNHKDDM